MERHGSQPEPVGRLAEWRQARRRLRWRLRGAWMWPAFVVLTVLDGVVLIVLPFYEGAPDRLVAGILLAGFANLFAVAVVAPLAGRLLRRRRRDLPRVVAVNYAGTTLVVAIAAVFVVGGLLHRPAAAAADAERQAVFGGVHDYVISQQPELRGRLGETDTVELEPHLFRACVPTGDARRWLCLFVSTDQSPPGLRRDPSAESNDARRTAGFQ
jgi:hypothetical protein